MRYEFIHDSIAKQVYFKAGAEARTRRKVEKYIREHYEAYQERGAELTDDDIDYIKPYLGLVNISAEQAQFVRRGERKLQRKRMRRRVVTAAIIAVLSAATVISLILLRRATVAETEAQENFILAEQKSDSLAQKEQELQSSLLTTEVARDSAQAAYRTADTLRLEAEAAEALAKLEAANARRAEADANRRAREAQSLAVAATASGIEDELPEVALKLAETAYSIIPDNPLPTVAQTLSGLFYEQFADDEDPGAPLFRAVHPYDGQQFAGNNPDRRRRFSPAWSPDGRYYLLPTGPGRADVYQRDGQRTATVRHTAAPYYGGYIERVGARGILRVDTIRGAVPPIDAAAWSPRGDRFATGDEAGRIKIWSPAGTLLAESQIPDWVSELRFSPDGRFLYAWANPFTISSLESDRRNEIPGNRHLWIWDTERAAIEDSGLLVANLSQLFFTANGMSFLLPSGQYLLTGEAVQSFDIPEEGKGREVVAYNGRSDVALVRYQGTFRLWSLQEQEPTLTVGSADQPARQAILAPDGRSVLAFFENKLAILYSADGRPLSELPPDDYRRGTISPQGNYIAVTSDEQELVWDLRRETAQPLTEDINLDIAPRFIGNDELLFLSGEKELARWQPREGVEPFPDLHADDVRAVAPDPSGRYLLSRDEGNIAYLWSLSGEPLSRYDKHQAFIEAAVFDPAGETLVTADRAGRAYQWRVNAMALAQQVATPQDPIERIMTIPHTEDFVTVSAGGQYTIRSWDEAVPDRPLTRSRRAEPLLASSPDGRLLATQIGNRPISVWDRATGQERATLDPGRAAVNHLTFTADSRTVVAVTERGQLLAWPATGGEPRSWPADANANGAIKVAPSGGFLHTDPGPVLFRPASELLSVQSAYAPTGGYLVADDRFVPPLFRIRKQAGAALDLQPVQMEMVAIVPTGDEPGSGVRVWGTNGTLRKKIRYQGVSFPERIHFSPDGALFAVQLYRQGTVVYDSLGNQHRLNVALGGPQYVFFSPDNRYLLATYGGATARLISRSGATIAQLDQLNENIAAASFSPDGRYILLRGSGTTAQLYDLQGQLLATFDRHAGELRAAHFSTDGQFVVTLDASGTLRRYPVPGRIYAWLRETGRLPALDADQRKRYGLSELAIE
jgi:WD40 repeat protein